MTAPDDKRISFELGTVVATIGATMAADNHAILELLRRHACGDWGDLGEEDKKANDRALKHGDRILSSYRLPSGEKLWLLTEADRSATTVMTPGEY